MKKAQCSRPHARTLTILFFLASLLSPAPPAGAQELPAGPRELLEISLENWNEFYGKNVRAEGWTYEGRIDSEGQRSKIVAEMTDPAKAWFPSGDVAFPDRMTALRIIDDRTRGHCRAGRARKVSGGRKPFAGVGVPGSH